MTGKPAASRTDSRRAAWRRAARVACWPLALAVPVATGSQTAAPGVVVEELDPSSTLVAAGVESGDVVTAWQRPGGASKDLERAPIESLFDWLQLEIEQAPRGTLQLIGERDGEAKTWQVPPGLWEARIRPRFPAPGEADYLAGRNLIEAGDVDAGVSLLAGAFDASPPAAPCWRSWRHWQLAEAWAASRDWQRALAEYRLAEYRLAPEAAEGARQEGCPAAAAAFIRDAIGSCHEQARELAEAAESFDSALRLRRAEAGASLATAQSLYRLGALATRQRQLDRAQALLQEALAIQQRLAAESLAVAASLNSLGGVAWYRRQLDEAESYYLKALALRRELAPGSLQHARSLNNLGVLAWSQGDLKRAEDHYRRAQEIKEQLAPDSMTVALGASNLGVLARHRGDLELARESFERALAINEKQNPGSLEVAGILNNLGIVANNRGELDLARTYYERALKIHQALAPDSLQVASSLENLGILARHQGDATLAEATHRQALAITEKLAPDSLDMTSSLNNLGLVAIDRGRLQQARDLFSRALAIDQLLAPDSLRVATVLNNLGRVAVSRGETQQAAEYIRRALEIRERLSPGSQGVADTLHDLGSLYRDTGQPQLAVDLWRRAIDALENQVGRLGGSRDVEAAYQTRHRDYYRDLIELLLELDHPEHAFAVLERSRARGLLKMLAERDLIFSTDIPQELEQARRSLAVRYDRTLHQLVGLSRAKDSERIEELLSRLRDLQRERADVIAEIRRIAPGLAALQYPQPLDLQASREALDPGTVMLSFSVGKERTFLFVVRRGRELQVANLEVGERELAEEVHTFGDLIRQVRPDSSLGSLREMDLERVARRLYRRLLEPVSAALEASERLLVVADGPLHLLPFAALIRGSEGALGSNEAAAGGRYLVQWKPVHSALSATVYAELGKARRPRRRAAEGPMVAFAFFGDPRYPSAIGDRPAATIADLRLRSSVERGLFDWRSLTYTRREVIESAALYPPALTRAYLGPEATEERAKALDSETRVLHFAVHGYFDDRSPLDSALALTIPAAPDGRRDNGLLQAWEIFESLRLDADLAVLSACATGLGQEQGGEGLIGLTRAFQYAGARTVAATLWDVHDRSTAELMIRFYRHLQAGLTKDAALRAAQIELIEGPIEVADGSGEPVRLDATAPYYWAGFHLFGDWR